MVTILGIESTAHTFGIGVVKNGKVLSNVKRSFSTEHGGMIPIEVAKFHNKNKYEVYEQGLKEAGIKENEISAIAFSQGPGLAPCLLEGMKLAKKLSKKLKKPIVSVNHCIAHLEIGKITGAKNPVMLYASGANTQVIAYASGKYRVFGETLDVGVGNFIDTFARYAGIGFPGGPKIEMLAKISTRGNYIELPYKVKGMDVALSGILTKLRQMIESPLGDTQEGHENLQAGDSGEPKYKLEDLAYSLQETVFAMLVETAERALAHTGKNELLLGGGVACNSRLKEMCKIMCKERKAKFFCPENSLLVDNAAMIAYLGEIMFKAGIKEFPRDDSSKDDTAVPSGEPKNLNKIDIAPRQRTDEVIVKWK